MKQEPKGPVAARWRQRKFQRLGRYPIPPDLLPGSLSRSRTRCGKPSCHCANGEDGFSGSGFTAQQVEAGRNFQEAVREVLTANAELLILARKQESQHRR